MEYKFSSYMTSVRYTIKLLLHLSEAGTWPPWYPMFKKRKTHCRSRVSRVERQQSNTAVLPNHCWLALPYSWSSGIVFVMKLEKLVSRAYTPGLFCWAQPSPKLTTPACTQVPFTIRQTRGPPESPCADHTFRHTFSIHHWEVSKCSERRAPTVIFPCSFAYAVCVVKSTKKPNGLIQLYLAGVLAALLESSTDHVLQDVHLVCGVCLVPLLTWTLGNDWHLDFL